MPATPVFGDADIQSVIDGAGGVSVTVGAVTAKGKLRASDVGLEVHIPGESFAGAREASVIVRSSTFAGLLHQGVAATVDGTAYKITRVEQLGIGLMTRFYIAP
jgi:hypothetical protein